MTRILGWTPDLPDGRDQEFPLSMAAVPSKHSMIFTFHYDQFSIGSCVSNAIIAAWRFTEYEQDQDAPDASRLAHYYWMRLAQGTEKQDSGGTLRGGMKVLKAMGTCHEDLHPYRVENYRKAPGARAKADAAKHRLTDMAYASVQPTLVGIRAAVAADNPVAFGMPVYDGFMSQKMARTGIYTMPDLATERVQGGHAMLIAGYDDDRRAFLVKNSWGRRWGIEGYCWIPYEFMIKYARDFWTIYRVPGLS